MFFQEALGEIIREERLAQKKTLRDLSKSGHIALGYLSEVERGQKQASSEVVEAVAHGLGKQAYELIIEAGYRMSVETIPNTAEKLFGTERTSVWLAQYSDLVR